MRHLDQEELTLLALAADDSELESARAHLSDCVACRRNYETLVDVVTLAWEAEPDDLQPPPPGSHVWEAIRSQLAAPAPRSAAEPPALRRWLRGAAAVVVGVALGIGATLGWQAATRTGPVPATVVAQSALAPPPGGPPGGSGSVRLVRLGGQLVLEVDAGDLPLTNGYYEAWMFIPGTTRMQAMGAVQPGREARFPVPAGLDPAGWRGIDISAETFDGNPAHSATSVLRGELRR